ncbi:3'-5' exonuclease [Kineosporia succinea]|uniref:DNA 3'-5' helicase n=1 Tax=Kineosporia succinea TaxID=84632 RepID=A0ABT9PCQ0_9ACTN|nr:3'-5' exonuclease [Kineosporia succinea]MDP9830174.1 superfamily I DNA/RNA helicase [Kineosporia succinea]
MPIIVMTKQGSKLDASIKKKAYSFLEKLAEDDTTLGLHIEPIQNSADPKVRTGRVDQAYRAVLFRLPGEQETTYVFYGIWMHDDAIAIAKKVVLELNPVNGITEIRTVEPAEISKVTPVVTARVPDQRTITQQPALLAAHGVTLPDLLDLGIDQNLAENALQVTDEDGLEALLSDAVEWQGMALIELGAGTSVTDVRDHFSLTKHAVPATSTSPVSASAAIVAGMSHPAAQMTFAYAANNDELRRIIEGGDFGAWRVWLHPEQRRYVDKTWNGPFRLSGGAGTGKTVVVLHRAAELARRHPHARIILTTFTTNLATALSTQLNHLDPTLPRTQNLAEPGIHITGIDALASAVLRNAARAGQDLSEDIIAVLGSEAAGSAVTGSNAPTRIGGVSWRDALDVAGSALPPELQSESFMAAEYGSVILPNLITTREQYYRARRPGRGVALDRGRRKAVWEVVQARRAQARIDGVHDFAETSAIAAAHLRRTADTGLPADHVLVDEGQDLSATHWQLLRALVAEHPDDLFIAEDSHQRIYGRRIVLSQFGIRIVGRSQRLTLNYRTTAENLAFALRVLSGGSYTDLEETAEDSTAYRSARRGKSPAIGGRDSLRSELDHTATLLQTWSDATDAPETLAVLVRDRFQRDRVVNGLAERGLAVRAVDREEIKPGQPVVMTMHRAKGTEFSKVLLFGINEGSIPAGLKDEKYSDDAWNDALLRERSLLYVAATRARDELAVTWSGDASSLLSAATE